MVPSPDRQPRKTPPVTAEKSLTLLRQLVDRFWPLARHWQNPGARAISFELQSTPTSPILSFLMVTASGSRSGDMVIRFVDLNFDHETRNQTISQSIKDGIFSREFVFRPEGSPRSRAIFNGLCLVADILQRDTQSRKVPRDLECGEAEKVISRAITQQIDFSNILKSPAPKLYCDDFERLPNGELGAWIEFKLAPDQSAITITFSQKINSNDYDPYNPSICVREPFAGGSHYVSGRVYAALKVLFAADGLYSK